MLEELSEEEKQEERRRQEEEARQAKVREAEDKVRQAEEARIRAEAERDAFKQLMGQAQSGQTGSWSDEQWTRLEEQTGLKKEAFLANAQVAKELVDKATKSLEDRSRKAEERAAKAEERLNRIEGARTEDSVKTDFFKSRPNLQRYQQDVESFLSDYPEESRRDPVKLKGLLEKAEIYVKGKVGDKMRTSASVGGGPRFGRDDETMHREEEEVVPDTEGLDAHQANLIQRINPPKEELKRLKEQASDLRDGIALSGDREWRETEAAIKQQFRR